MLYIFPSFLPLNTYDFKLGFLLDDGTGECRLFEGEWVQEPDGESSLAYTNGSCVTIPDSKNCFKHGRVDTEFLHWRWKPNGCEIPRFDARKFLRIVRGKTMGFIGDSVSRNHVDSLLCLLSKVIRAYVHFNILVLRMISNIYL